MDLKDKFSLFSSLLFISGIIIFIVSFILLSTKKIDENTGEIIAYYLGLPFLSIGLLVTGLIYFSSPKIL